MAVWYIYCHEAIIVQFYSIIAEKQESYLSSYIFTHRTFCSISDCQETPLSSIYLLNYYKVIMILLDFFKRLLSLKIE